MRSLLELLTHLHKAKQRKLIGGSGAKIGPDPGPMIGAPPPGPVPGVASDIPVMPALPPRPAPPIGPPMMSAGPQVVPGVASDIPVQAKGLPAPPMAPSGGPVAPPAPTPPKSLSLGPVPSGGPKPLLGGMGAKIGAGPSVVPGVASDIPVMSQGGPAPTAPPVMPKSPLLGGGPAPSGTGMPFVSPDLMPPPSPGGTPNIPDNPESMVPLSSSPNSPGVNGSDLKGLLMASHAQGGDSNPEQVSAPEKGTGHELPYQTYERLTGQHWTGGNSEQIQDMLSRLGVEGPGGAASTNLALQKALIANAMNGQGAQ